MGKPSAPEPPDYTEVAAASEKASKYAFRIAKQQLAWAKEQYSMDAKVYDRVVDGFLEDMDVNSKNAAEDRRFYENNFRPLEKDLAKEAQNYDTAARRREEMGAAQAGVAEQFAAQRENAQRELEAYGIDPSSTRYAALDIGVRTSQAATQAAAGTAASNRVEDVGRALRSEAINVGRGYPGQIASSYQTAAQMGSGASGATGQATSIGGQTMGTGLQWQGAGNQAVGQWGNTLNMGYNNQIQQFNANQQASSGWGSALGLIGGLATGMFEDGGYVQEQAIDDGQRGGVIHEGMSPSGGEVVDDVPARLNAGEFVIPDDVVSWYGEKHMYGLIEKASKERDMAKQTTGAIPEEGPPLQSAPVYQSA